MSVADEIEVYLDYIDAELQLKIQAETWKALESDGANRDMLLQKVKQQLGQT